MVSQAEEGMKLFEAQQGTAAEVDRSAAEPLEGNAWRKIS